MKHYIKTIDGKIVELKPHRFYKYVLEGEKLYLSGKGKYLYINNVVSQAYTIEELCDEFVLIRNSIIRVYPKKHLLEESITGYCIGDEVYGAIWNDKGLIYVAKIRGILPNGEIDWELL